MLVEELCRGPNKIPIISVAESATVKFKNINQPDSGSQRPGFKSGGVGVMFACSSCDCECFPWILQFPPWPQKCVDWVGSTTTKQ